MSEQPHILIADDDELVRFAIAEILHGAGYHNIAFAIDGRRAIEHLERMPADLVILDIFMPIREGIETLIQIKHLHPATKVIMISGGGGRMKAFNALELAERFGPDAMITKPVSGAALLKQVARLLPLAKGTTKAS